MSSPDAPTPFFANLPVLDHFEQLTTVDAYTRAPEGFLVVITDVIDSTAATAAGSYRDVNIVGAGSIAAVLNACRRAPLPYCFRGDGAIVLAPSEHRPAIVRALNQLVRTARDAFDLEVRIGAVPVHELRARGHDVLVARYALSENVAVAAFAGGGIDVASRLIKAPDTAAQYSLAQNADVPDDPRTFNGLFCRWAPIPSKHGCVATVIVRATSEDPEARLRTYRGVLDDIDRIAEGRDLRPLSQENMRLADLGELSGETKLRLGERSGPRYHLHRGQLRAVNAVGNTLLRTGGRVGGFDRDTYVPALIQQSDFRKLDGTLRMVLDVTGWQRSAIEGLLEARHQDGELVYGIHTSEHALITCLVRSMERDHVHFIDGAGGGYAAAAAELRRRWGVPSD